MQYPLELSFKIMALSPQIAVRDATDQLQFYVKQKLFKLKEAVTVFADEEQTQPLYQINADRVLDFSARYRFTDPGGRELGSVKRQGMKSLWRSHFDVMDGDGVVLTIQEENPWVKVANSVFESIPLVGMFSGYVFHPAFVVARSDSTVALRLEKRPAFFEGKFRIDQVTPLSPAEETRALLSLMMMLLLEHKRG
jgi:hypothetical protein